MAPEELQLPSISELISHGASVCMGYGGSPCSVIAREMMASASCYRHEVAMARQTDHMVMCVDQVVHTSCGWLKQLALIGGRDVT